MHRTRLSLLVTAFVLYTLSANATVLVPADLGELARDAGAIVRGRVVAADTRWSGGRRAIETVVTLDVEASLKGSLGRTVQFIVPGGTLGRYRSLFVGAPQFAAAERVVVFLGWRGPSYPYLLGLGQGVFRISSDGNRSGAKVSPPPLIAPAAGASRVVRGDVSRVPMPLAAFEQRVRALAGGQR
ncbi:MAG: hypothetical protein ABI868_05545 [Acidobacteriota bacterium]